MSNVWQRVIEICASGSCPEISLKPEWEIKKEKQSSGRPRVRLSNDPYSHYAGRGDFGRRPICKGFKCRKYLKKDQPLCCSTECLDDLISRLSNVLSKLKVAELDELLRSILGPDYRIFQREDKEKRRPRFPKTFREISKVG